MGRKRYEARNAANQWKERSLKREAKLSKKKTAVSK